MNHICGRFLSSYSDVNKFCHLSTFKNTGMCESLTSMFESCNAHIDLTQKLDSVLEDENWECDSQSYVNMSLKVFFVSLFPVLWHHYQLGSRQSCENGSASPTKICQCEDESNLNIFLDKLKFLYPCSIHRLLTPWTAAIWNFTRNKLRKFVSEFETGYITWQWVELPKEIWDICWLSAIHERFLTTVWAILFKRKSNVADL